MSRKYKESANCRLEGEYAFRRRKVIIPLMMQPQYDADGWLGAIVGTKIYYKVTSPDEIGNAVKGVLKELKKIGLKAASTTASDPKPTTPTVPAPTPKDSNLPPKTNKEAISWDVAQVGGWLQRVDLGHHRAKFEEHRINGKALAWLASALRKVPPNPTEALLSPWNGGYLGFTCAVDYMCFMFELEKLSFV